MAHHNSEEDRRVQKIRVITFRIAKELPPNIITRKYVAEYLDRSDEFVKNSWLKNPFAYKIDNSLIRKFMSIKTAKML